MEALDILKLRIPEEKSEEVLFDCLELAQGIILENRFPFGTDRTEIEPQYKSLQIRIAIDLYNKRGAEGETSHSENGVSRNYDGAWVSKQLLDEIIPKAEVL